MAGSADATPRGQMEGHGHLGCADCLRPLKRRAG